jgi:HAD superfamily hydrolase (TIGR01490 family)
VQASRTPIAVFDLDGTSVNGQSGSLISQYLLRHHVVSLPSAARLAWWGIRYKLRLPHRQGEPREVILRSLNRAQPNAVRETMHTFHDEVMVPRYYQEALSEVARRKAEGCVTLLVSATFHEVAERAANYMGVDAFVATEMQQGPDGQYLALVAGEVVEGKEKVRAVARWADEHLGSGSWYIAYAYGDHHSDQQLLCSAHKAYVVNPSYALKFSAKRHQWDILKWGTTL